MDPLIREDKLRGALFGLIAGETLGAPVAGWTRDEILRRHGRVVHRLEGARPGRLTAAALALGPRLLAGESLEAAADTDDGEALVATLLRALLGDPGSAATVAGDAADARPGLAEASRWLTTVVGIALAEDPYRRLPADRLIASLAAVSRLPEATPALTRLAEHTMSPPPPGEAPAAYAALPPPLGDVALAIHALLVRPRSVEEATVYAVNLGGEAALRGALAGALAGAHRGAASVPERWTEGLVETAPLNQLALAMAERRRRSEFR